MIRTAVAVAIGIPLGLGIDRIMSGMIGNPWIETGISVAALFVFVWWVRARSRARTP